MEDLDPSILLPCLLISPVLDKPVRSLREQEDGNRGDQGYGGKNLGSRAPRKKIAASLNVPNLNKELPEFVTFLDNASFSKIERSFAQLIVSSLCNDDSYDEENGL